MSPFPEMRPVVYVAGPYTKPDPCVNTKRAVAVADTLVANFPGVVPVIPHLSHFWHTMSPKPYSFWTDMDLELLRRCDVMFRFDGDSPGADGEEQFADHLGIPVVRTLMEFDEWWRGWRDRVIEWKAYGLD